MKSIGSILGVIAFVGMCVLSVLQFTKGKTAKARPKVVVTNAATGKQETIEAPVAGTNIAYVDLDTLEGNYKYFKQKKSEFETKDKNLGAELERAANEIQTEYAGLQARAQQGKLSETEGAAAEKRLMQKQQDLEKRRQNEGTALLDDQEKFNKELQDNIRGFLNGYAEEKGYDYILAYTSSSTILYANEELDVTQDVIDALNSGKKFNTKKKTDDDVKTSEKAPKATEGLKSATTTATK
jgi:outer membrane protein